MGKSNSREEKLFNVLKAEEDRESGWLKRFYYYRKRIRLGINIKFLAGLCHTRGLKKYFIDGDLAAMKQNFYLASKLTIFSIGQDGGEELETTVPFLYGLLSDDKNVIGELASVETKKLIAERHNPLNARFAIHMWQLAIKGEDEELRSKIAKVAAHGRKPERNESVAGVDFFSLLLKRDKVGLEKRIQDKFANIKGDYFLFEDFMAYRATLEAKLCWYRGIPVQIDSPLVPMNLMPIKPLNHYDDVYDFLKPGWVPPRQGLLGKISRWFGRNG